MIRKDYTRMTLIAGFVVLFVAGCTVKTEPFPVGTYLCSAELDNAFMEDGTFKISGGGSVITEGHYTIDGDEITIVDDSCSGEGVYRWSYKDGTLMFEAIDDNCSIRRSSLTAGLNLKP
jgi:hypothetical protein